MENSESNKTTANGWQNIGIFYILMRDSSKLTGKESDVFMDIVRNSVGFGQEFINQMSQNNMAKLFGMSSNTLNKSLKKLESLKLIMRVDDTSYTIGGGSKPQRIGPVFPKNAHIWIKDKSIQAGSEKPDTKLDTLIKQKEESDLLSL